MAKTADTLPPLDLTTDHKRPIVKIDGTAYEMRTANDLSLEDFRFVQRAMPVLSEIEQRKGKALQDCRDLYGKLVDLVLMAPAAVKARLNDVDRVLVVSRFILLSLSGLLARARAIDQALGSAPPQTPTPSPRSSRGSAASTAAIRSTGSRKSRSARSANVH